MTRDSKVAWPLAIFLGGFVALAISLPSAAALVVEYRRNVDGPSSIRGTSGRTYVILDRTMATLSSDPRPSYVARVKVDSLDDLVALHAMAVDLSTALEKEADSNSVDFLAILATVTAGAWPITVDQRWGFTFERDAKGTWQDLTRDLSKYRLYTRDTLDANFPEARKAKAVPFLDECHAAADHFLKTYYSRNEDAILSEIHSPEPFSRADFDRLTKQLADVFGKVTATDYRNTVMLLGPGDTLELLQEPEVQVEYAATTTKWTKSAGIFFAVNLARSADSCHVVGFRIHKYAAGEPEYLQAPKSGR